MFLFPQIHPLLVLCQSGRQIRGHSCHINELLPVEYEWQSWVEFSCHYLHLVSFLIPLLWDWNADLIETLF
jgi:hypothetical protein